MSVLRRVLDFLTLKPGASLPSLKSRTEVTDFSGTSLLPPVGASYSAHTHAPPFLSSSPLSSSPRAEGACKGPRSEVHVFSIDLPEGYFKVGFFNH